MNEIPPEEGRLPDRPSPRQDENGNDREATPIKRIVVGFDAREESDDALRLGGELARTLGAQLIVAAALEYAPLGIEAPSYPQAVASFFAGVKKRARENLGTTEFEWRELRDTAAHGLNNLAEDELVDLIVVGSTHRGAIGRVLPGSVGQRLLTGAPCAMAVAPRGWARGHHVGIGSIGVGFDARPESERAFEWAARLGSALGQGLRVITAVPPTELGSLELSDELRDEYERQIKAAVTRLPIETYPEIVLEAGRPADVLAKHGVEVDLLVVGSRGYGPLRHAILGGVTAELIRIAPCPVLLLARSAEPDRSTGPKDQPVRRR